MADELGDYSVNIQSMPIQATDPQLGRWVESADDLLQLLEYDLACKHIVYKENKDGGITTDWIRDEGVEPLMNEQGIRFIIGKLRTVCSRNTFLSDLDENRVYQIGLLTSMSITANLYVRMKEFGVKDTITCDLIIEEINNVMELALRRAINRGEAKGLFSMHKTIESLQNRPQQQQSKGLFGLTSK